MDVTIDALRGVPLFSELDDETLGKILLLGKDVDWAAGATVIEEEDRRGEAFHLIIDGDAEVSAHGKPVAVATPGDSFGELSLIDGKPRSAKVTAISDLRTFSLASWHFHRLMDEQPGLRHQLMISLCDRIRQLTDAISS
jgi:CRP/FNR family transcriptional regulator/CRP/FNR family cyclic AMP-dependent transcriptional regulator